MIELGRFIAEGPDSRVYHTSTGLAVKEYQRPIDLIEAYGKVSNLVEAMLWAKPYTGLVKLGGKEFSLRYWVNHVFTSYEDERRGTVSTSPFIPGPTLLDLTKPREEIAIEERYNLADRDEIQRQFKLIINPTERDFLMDLYIHRQSGKGLVEEINPDLRRFSDDVNSWIGPGINVTPINVKVRYNPHIRQVNFVVTDLCAYIPFLTDEQSEN